MKKYVLYADVVTVGLIAFSLPSYYKLKFFLDGQMAWRDMVAPGFWIEYLFSTLLAIGLIVVHRAWSGNSRLQFFAVAIASAGAAALFTWFYFTIVFPLGITNSFIFDIVILSLLTPLLISGVRDRVFLAQRASVEALRARQAENTALIAQYEALKARLSPHFLFNSLNTLADIVEDDPALASQFIDRMARVYRYIIEYENAAEVSLEKEIEAACAFLFVLNTRHPGALQVTMPTADEIGGYDIAPLTLQTLVENVLKHNIFSKDAPLEIIIKIDAGDIVVENSINLRHHAESLKTGLKSLEKRLAIICDRPLQTGQSDGCFWVRAPLMQTADA